MNYRILNLSIPPTEIFKEVIESEHSLLLIPPTYQKEDLEIEKPDSEKKMIGLFSSGTTAQPKCIWNSFENLKLNAKRSIKAFDITAEDCLLIIAKPWHVAGLSWAIMAENLGNEYEFVTSQKGESTKWLKVIQDFKPDYLLTVPPVFRSIYNQKWEVENIITGGIPLEHNDFNFLKNHSQKVYQGYGQTEAGGLISVHSFNSDKTPESNEHLNCGIPIQGVQLKTKGTPNSPNPVLIQSETACQEIFYDSGDLGYLKDEEIYLTGRVKEVISKKD